MSSILLYAQLRLLIASRFMYSNVYGLAGVTKLIQLMKTEILSDAAQIGITDISKIDPKRVSVLDI